MLARLEEAFGLAEAAPRADQRSQGYRLLLKSLAEAPARLMDRFPQPTLDWLEPKAATRDVALRSAMSELLDKARSRGHGVSAPGHATMEPFRGSGASGGGEPQGAGAAASDGASA